MNDERGERGEKPPAPVRLITQKEPWPALVERLKQLAEAAERGEMCAFAYVYEGTDGAMRYHAFHGSGSYPIKMVGELEVLKLAVVQRHCERADD